jgi:hypothetical protein
LRPRIASFDVGRRYRLSHLAEWLQQVEYPLLVRQEGVLVVDRPVAQLLVDVLSTNLRGAPPVHVVADRMGLHDENLHGLVGAEPEGAPLVEGDGMRIMF